MRFSKLILFKTGLFFLFLFSVFGSACRKNDPKPEYPAGTNERINSWVLDSMKVYYYWNTSLPSSPDINRQPLDFFASIRNAGDRFSRLINPAVPESYYPSLIHNFGLDLAVYQSGNSIQSVVALVVRGSQAANEGIVRGAMVSRINGQTITGSNVADLIEASIKARKIVLEVEGKGSMTLGAGITSENPVYDYRILNADGIKVAYLFLNAFEGRTKFDLEKAFAYFKQQQASEFILDLRYNPGGDIGVAAVMAALLAPVKPSDVFVEYHGNQNAGIRKSSFENAFSLVAPGYPFSFSEVEAWRLPLKRVFILTGSHTASASEFLIQGLKPWTSVVQVGSKTLGKDMASFVIQEKNNPASVGNWSIEPMIFKLYNSQGKGDYPTGLSPDIEADEFSIPIQPLGSLNDPLIVAALTRINRPPSRERGKLASFPASPVKVLFHSRDQIDLHPVPVRVKR